MNISTLLICILIPFIDATAETPATPAANVEIGIAKTTRLAPQRWVPGSVVSRDDAKIASAEAGRLDFVAEVGTRVKSGERIAKLDDQALRLHHEEILSDVRRAEAQRQLSATQLERLTKLASGTSVAATQLDESRAQLETNVQNLAHARAQQRQIEHDIEQTDVHAPFSGVVTERFAQRGEYLQVGASIVHLVDSEHVEARVQAPLALAGKIHSGTSVTVKSAGVEQAANVRATVPVGDEHSRQFELRVVLDGSFALVGSAVEVALPESDGNESLAVPRDALVQRANATYVMRISEKNIAEQIAVTTGASNGDLVEVRGLLAAGDRLVVRGAERLSAGQAVLIAKQG
ncbi:efflux RND transporter periplasmic adaptor subunit [Pseudolysobacter antarcticus]|uniref:Efflux RND transporter periplasmic adaptor subunit n=1 Tax=Pseudolysobacter antarcticus TaxID=2511995 RepID=A0A411HKQ3_9GAMM|nr:efflux RND transporter periplasmic adaptor subunit [Pseudolysobacter antarcticus]QBB71109.1 efflux RND transporter periplasmic adaptor subunit [Pseudolysobacter antarcticus]